MRNDGVRSSITDYPWHVRPNITDDPFYLPYSSGTTGVPKGVVLTQRNLVATSTLFW